MGEADARHWSFFPPSEAPSVQEHGDEYWRHFDKSVNAISFGFVATAILISMFLVMAIFERFLMTTSPSLAPSGDSGGGSRRSAADVESEMVFNSKHGHSSPKVFEDAREVSVVMPGEDVPTFIAQPTPVICQPEHSQLMADRRTLNPKIISSPYSQEI